MAKEDGGPAFPRPGWNECPDGCLPGMTLREWYAGQALKGILTMGHTAQELDAKRVAESAFRFADAMIEEGKKGSTTPG